MQKTLLSFHGREEIKAAHLAQLQAHYAADEIVQGVYWERGKGCDTGCSFHSGDHRQWEKQLGIPIIIGRLRDKIFEGIPNADAKEFPLLISGATPVGKNLRPVWVNFLLWLLIDEQEGVIRYVKKDDTRKAITDLAALLKRSLSDIVTEDEFSAAALRAAAADAAAYASYAASYASYAASYAAAAAAYAADAAAAAAYAADAADAAADAAAAAAYADDAARSRKYLKMRDKLVELLQAA